MPSRTKPVLAIGAIMADVVCTVPQVPRSGEGVVAESAAVEVGGCAFNSACAVRELGFDVRLFAPLGAGLYADHLRARLRDRGFSGVDVQGADRDNGVCLCMVEPGGERTMLTLPGIDRRYDRAWFRGLDAADYACAVVSGYEIEPTEGDAIVSFLGENPGLPVYFGPGPRICGISKEKIARINALRPVWHLNDLEALQYTGLASVEEAGWALLSACGNAVVITEGARGARAFTEEGSCFVPTKPVRALDTVGAGDAHVGALAALRSAGQPWEDSLRIANKVSGIVCRQQGASLRPGSLAALAEEVQRQIG